MQQSRAEGGLAMLAVVAVQTSWNGVYPEDFPFKTRVRRPNRGSSPLSLCDVPCSCCVNKELEGCWGFTPKFSSDL